MSKKEGLSISFEKVIKFSIVVWWANAIHWLLKPVQKCRPFPHLTLLPLPKENPTIRSFGSHLENRDESFSLFFLLLCKECVRTAQIYQTPSSKSFQIDEIRRFWTPPVAHQPNYAVFTCCLIRIAQVGYSITPVSVRPISYVCIHLYLY